jgi:hypothetical protein
MEKKTSQFEIRTADGRIFTVYEFTNFIEVPADHNSDQGTVFPGMKRLSTENGMAVNSLGNDLYEVVELRVDAKRIDG